MDKIIRRRIGQKVIGFNGSASSADLDANLNSVLASTQPGDLIKFGMIPEFIGRFPVLSTFNPLSESELVEVMVKPRNAIVRQYMKFFEMENVKLTIQDDALVEIAREALAKETGARAIRAILEQIMLEVMFDLPGQKEVVECIVTLDCLTRRTAPILVYRNGKRAVA